MDYTELLKLVPQLIGAGLRIAEIIDAADDISDDDKAAMKAEIEKAKDGVTYWVDEDKPVIHPRPEITPLP